MKDNPEHRLPKADTKMGLWDSVKNGWKETMNTLQKWFWGGSHDGNSCREIGTSPNPQKQDPSDWKQHRGTQRRPCHLEANWRIVTGPGKHRSQHLITLQPWFCTTRFFTREKCPRSGHCTMRQASRHSTAPGADNQEPQKSVTNPFWQSVRLRLQNIHRAQHISNFRATLKENESPIYPYRTNPYPTETK